MILNTIFLAGTILGAAAQSLDLSQQCTQSLASIATDPAAACLNPTALAPLLLGASNISLIEPIDAWLGGICNLAPCSNTTLATLVNTLASGCATDLSLLGITGVATEVIVGYVQEFYPTFRKIVCLKNNDENCVTQSLTTIQNAAGSLTFESLPNVMASEDLPSNITCTDCFKEAYNIIRQDIPSFDDAEESLQAQCGSSFTDGSTPAGIAQTALGEGNATTSAGSTNSTDPSNTNGSGRCTQPLFMVLASLGALVLLR